MRISDWSSDVCSSDLRKSAGGRRFARQGGADRAVGEGNGGRAHHPPSFAQSWVCGVPNFYPFPNLRKTVSARAMILVIDNYDSFTFNLVHYLIELGAEEIGRASCRERVCQYG